MAIRKFTADRIFNGTSFLERQVVCLRDDNTLESIIPIAEAGEGVQHLPGLLSPGFVNAHCHLELSHFLEKIPKGMGIKEFVRQIIHIRREEKSQEPETREAIYQAMIKACDEMQQSGVVAVGDISNQRDSIRVKANPVSPASRPPIHFHTFVESLGWNPARAEESWKETQAVYHDFKVAGLSASLVPHAPYSLSYKLWDLLTPALQDQVISMHNMESEAEREFAMYGTGPWEELYREWGMGLYDYQPSGKSGLESVWPYLEHARQLLLIHNTDLRESDIVFIQQSAASSPQSSVSSPLSTVHPPHPATYLCLCIRANQYIENKQPDIDILKKTGLKIVIGTDSLASNDSLNLVEELKAVHQAFPHIGWEEILTWATVNGAEALGLDPKQLPWVHLEFGL